MSINELQQQTTVNVQEDVCGETFRGHIGTYQAEGA